MESLEGTVSVASVVIEYQIGVEIQENDSSKSNPSKSVLYERHFCVGQFHF